jgi:hypothetical protein
MSISYFHSLAFKKEKKNTTEYLSVYLSTLYFHNINISFKIIIRINYPPPGNKGSHLVLLAYNLETTKKSPKEIP